MDYKNKFKSIITFEKCWEATQNLIKKDLISKDFKGDNPTLELICTELGLKSSYKPNIEKIRNVFVRNNVSP